MFNGIIKNTGIIKNIQTNKANCILEIKSSMHFSQKEIGSSISCSGACLTITKYKNKIITFFVSKETLSKTSFNHFKKGDLVNLEKSLIFGTRISGHFVQGHVDTITKVSKINFVGKSWEIDFKLRNYFKKYIVYKGSIAINGVSLTVAKILKDSFKISVIPHTLKLTNLIKLKKNDIVNVEFDILAKYIKNP